MRVLLIPGADQSMEGAGVSVQEVMIPEPVLHQQVDDGFYGYEGYQQQQESENYGFEEQEMSTVNTNKYSYPYSVSDSVGEVDRINVAAVPTQRIQQLTALYNNKQAVLSIDSGC